MDPDYKINNLREELMNEIRTLSKDVSDIRVDIASLPKVLADEFDKRYASKTVEEDIKNLKDKQENRNYSWLKDIIMFCLGIVGSLVVFYLTK